LLPLHRVGNAGDSTLPLLASTTIRSSSRASAACASGHRCL